MSKKKHKLHYDIQRPIFLTSLFLCEIFSSARFACRTSRMQVRTTFRPHSHLTYESTVVLRVCICMHMCVCAVRSRAHRCCGQRRSTYVFLLIYNLVIPDRFISQREDNRKSSLVCCAVSRFRSRVSYCRIRTSEKSYYID